MWNYELKGFPPQITWIYADIIRIIEMKDITDMELDIRRPYLVGPVTVAYRQENGWWYAIALEFSLTGNGKGREAAFEQLQELFEIYAKEVLFETHTKDVVFEFPAEKSDSALPDQERFLVFAKLERRRCDGDTERTITKWARIAPGSMESYPHTWGPRWSVDLSKLVLTCEISRACEQFEAICVETGTATCGSTFYEAVENIVEALEVDLTAQELLRVMEVNDKKWMGK